MSSSFGRSSGPNTISPYAPKWARDHHASSESIRRAHEFFPHFPAGTSDDLTAQRPHFRSIEPTLVPEPPVPESWPLDEAAPLLRGSIAPMFFRFLFVVALAASIPFVVALFLPVGQRTALMQMAGWDSAATLGDTMPNPAVQQTPAMGRSELLTTRAEDSRGAPERFAAALPQVGPPVAATPSPIKTVALSKTRSPSSTSGNAVAANIEPAQRATVDHNPKASGPVTMIETEANPRQGPLRPLDLDEIEILLKQGTDFVSVGDFSSARLVFKRIAAAGDARGAFRLAATYDPTALQAINAKGATPDIAKARRWYAKASELGARSAGARQTLEKSNASSIASASKSVWSDADPRPGALKTTIGGSVASGSSDISSDGKATDTTIKESSNAPASDATLGTTVSYWKSGASIMRLEAIGAGRKFVFFKPSEEEIKAGAKAGSLRFDGQIADNGYSGTAFTYSKCGPERFVVSGRIENNGVRVILTGMSARKDRECREIGKTDQVLVFDFVSEVPPGGRTSVRVKRMTHTGTPSRSIGTPSHPAGRDRGAAQPDLKGLLRGDPAQGGR